LADINGTEEEQIEAIKAWLREYGAYIAAGLILGVGGVWGWGAWNDHRQAVAEAASQRYEVMLTTLEAGDNGLTAAREQGDALIAEQPESPYAVHTAFTLAQHSLDAGDTAAARDYLSWAANEGADEHMQHIARLRLARLQLFAGQDEAAALTTLKTDEPGAFAPLYAELRGDALLAQGDRDGAAAAYQSALDDWDESFGNPTLLELKLRDVSGPAPVASASAMEPSAADEAQTEQASESTPTASAEAAAAANDSGSTDE